MARRKKGESPEALALGATAEERQKKLDEAIAQIEKRFGQGTVGTLKGKHMLKVEPVDVVSTGCMSLDAALMIGGVPRGRVVEIYGPEASGKTTLALQIIARAQKTGGTAAFIDAEHALDPVYAEALGINLEEMLLSQPDSGEQGLNIAEALIRSGDFTVIVIDSVAALVPQAELDGETGDSHPGLQARMMSQALRKLAGIVHHSKTCLIFINQIRHKIGITFGSPETTSGGNALKFYASVRIDVRRIGSIKKGEDHIGNRVRFKVVKNKLAPPFRKCEVDLLFGKGTDLAGELLDYGVLLGIITKSGSWYSFGDKSLGQGKRSTAKQVIEHPELVEQITKAALKQIQGNK